MERVPAVPIRDHFASLTDPRCANARHHLLDILTLGVKSYEVTRPPGPQKPGVACRVAH